MFFDKKNKKEKKCENCGKKNSESYNFCPECGNSFLDSRNEKENFGLIGRNDFDEESLPTRFQSFGITDKLINSVFNSMMKSLDKQFKSQFKDIEKDLEGAEIKSFPNGIRIKISGPLQPHQRMAQRTNKKIINRKLDQAQIKKMGSLPREKAKTSVKRLGDKVIYELTTPGVFSPEDVFVSKLESGYEIKAIGDKKIYVNTLQINLPLKSCFVSDNKLLVEFQQD